MFSFDIFQGVFLFPNGFKKGKITNKKKKGLLLFEKIFKKDLWYETYKSNWEVIENELLVCLNICICNSHIFL